MGSGFRRSCPVADGCRHCESVDGQRIVIDDETIHAVPDRDGPLEIPDDRHGDVLTALESADIRRVPVRTRTRDE